MNIIPIVFAFDDHLIMPACVCITSLLENAAPSTFYDIYILHSDKFDFTLSALCELPERYANCKLTFRTVRSEFVSAYEIRGITITAYYRLLIPELIPEYDKILYSDVDVIFRDDLRRFYEIDLDNSYFGAVDVGVLLRKDIANYVEEKLKLDVQHGYFYSGNLIINSKEIRNDDIISIFRELSKNKYKYQDMDIINIACNGRIKSISPAFCLTNYLLSLILFRRNEYLCYFDASELDYTLKNGIIHYNGAKPWNSTCQNQDIWWYYYRLSTSYDDAYVYDFYENKINEIERWPLWKRIKHIFRYFGKKI